MAMMRGSGEDRRGARWRAAMWGAAAALLALPGVAMLFTGEVDWGAEDFLVFGAMLLVACIACEAAVRLIAGRGGRIAAIALVAAGFVLVWAELAVGIFH